MKDACKRFAVISFRIREIPSVTGISPSGLSRGAAAAHKMNDQEDDCERYEDVDESSRDMRGEPKDKPQNQKNEE
jgi:hypothetical protein